MHYQLRKDLSCCEVDGHIVFLDIAQDRYFTLTNDLESGLRRFLAHGNVSASLLRELSARGILPDASDPRACISKTSSRRPSRSAIEQPAAALNRGPGLATIIEVTATTWSIRHQLKTHALKTIIDDAIAYKRSKAGRRAIETIAYEETLLHAAWEFACARRYVPIDPLCLLDSLSLLRFLSRRGLCATLVFGVTLEPFTAHCWLQAGALVLNETLSDANTYTPIRTI
jgi:hypothetical protein